MQYIYGNLLGGSGYFLIEWRNADVIVYLATHLSASNADPYHRVKNSALGIFKLKAGVVLQQSMFILAQQVPLLQAYAGGMPITNSDYLPQLGETLSCFHYNEAEIICLVLEKL